MNWPHSVLHYIYDLNSMNNSNESQPENLLFLKMLIYTGDSYPKTQWVELKCLLKLPNQANFSAFASMKFWQSHSKMPVSNSLESCVLLPVHLPHERASEDQYISYLNNNMLGFSLIRARYLIKIKQLNIWYHSFPDLLISVRQPFPVNETHSFAGGSRYHWICLSFLNMYFVDCF